MTREERAVAFIRKLIDNGAWYVSAIELDHGMDGDDLLDEALSIVDEPEPPSEPQAAGGDDASHRS